MWAGQNDWRHFVKRELCHLSEWWVEYTVVFGDTAHVSIHLKIPTVDNKKPQTKLKLKKQIEIKEIQVTPSSVGIKRELRKYLLV